MTQHSKSTKNSDTPPSVGDRPLKILITGAAGSIGSELVKQLYKENIIYTLDFNETGINDLYVDYGVVGRVGDIRDYGTVEDVLLDFPADIIYHAAAYKHVNPMEVTPLEAIKTNVIGTYNILHVAKKLEVPKMVFISTDKVVNAKSVMGQTKKLAETMVINQGYTAVRFGNVLGSRGSVIPIWQRQMDEGKPLTVTDDKMERYLMTIEDAVELVIQAKDMGNKIVILDMKKKVNILELAKQIAKGHPIEMVGKGEGETLDEKLMTVEEEALATKQGKYYVIS